MAGLWINLTWGRIPCQSQDSDEWIAQFGVACGACFCFSRHSGDAVLLQSTGICPCYDKHGCVSFCRRFPRRGFLDEICSTAAISTDFSCQNVLCCVGLELDVPDDCRHGGRGDRTTPLSWQNETRCFATIFRTAHRVDQGGPDRGGHLRGRCRCADLSLVLRFRVALRLDAAMRRGRAASD